MNHPLDDILVARNELPLQWADDYRAYRVRVTRKLVRLRKEYKMVQRPAKGSSSTAVATTEGSEGKKQRVQRPHKSVTPADVAQDAAVVRVLLCLAERAWAEAMRTSSLVEARLGAPGTRLRKAREHVRSKLAKAAGYAERAAELLEEAVAAGNTGKTEVTETARLEVQAYAAMVKGHHAYESHRWAQCVQTYSVARVALVALANKAPTSGGSKDLLLDVVQTVVDEHLGYAVYQLRKVRPLRVGPLAQQAALEQAGTHPAVKLVQKVDAGVLSTEAMEASAANKVRTVTWRAHSAAVSNEDVGAALFETGELDKALAAKLETAAGGAVTAALPLFDPVLEAWQDTQDLVKANIKQSEEAASAAPHQQSIQDQYIVATFVGYSLLLRRIQRDTLLLKQLTSKTTTKKLRKMAEHAHDLIRIHETILQSTAQLLALPGVHTDSALFAALTGLDLFYTAGRLSLIAGALFVAGEQREALAVYERAGATLSKCVAATATGNVLQSAEFPVGVLDQEMLETAVLESETRRLQAQAVLTSETLKSNTTKTSNVAVIDSLSTYPHLPTKSIATNLVNLKAQKLEPVFVKPVFFDIAFNYIEYGSSKEGVLSHPTHGSASAAVEAAGSAGDVAVEETGTKKGFLKGLWGR